MYNPLGIFRMYRPSSKFSKFLGGEGGEGLFIDSREGFEKIPKKIRKYTFFFFIRSLPHIFLAQKFLKFVQISASTFLTIFSLKVS